MKLFINMPRPPHPILRLSPVKKFLGYDWVSGCPGPPGTKVFPSFTLWSGCVAGDKLRAGYLYVCTKTWEEREMSMNAAP